MYHWLRVEHGQECTYNVISTVEILQILGNPVRKAILTSLSSKQRGLRFSELMYASGLNPNFDTGHFGYHLSEMLKRGIIVKTQDHYRLSKLGVKLSKILDAVQRENSLLNGEQKNGREGMKWNEGFRSEFWQKHWLSSITAGWSRAEVTVESICKLFAENGVTSGKIFELCCGTGRLSILLAKRGFRTVGLDISSLYLDEAKSQRVWR